jgi:hypothetical protein
MSSNIIFPAVFLKAGNLPERLPLRSPQVPAKKPRKPEKIWVRTSKRVLLQ